jgi:hypothetical protein
MRQTSGSRSCSERGAKSTSPPSSQAENRPTNGVLAIRDWRHRVFAAIHAHAPLEIGEPKKGNKTGNGEYQNAYFGGGHAGPNGYVLIVIRTRRINRGAL